MPKLIYLSVSARYLHTQASQFSKIIARVAIQGCPAALSDRYADKPYTSATLISHAIATANAVIAKLLLVIVMHDTSDLNL